MTEKKTDELKGPFETSDDLIKMLKKLGFDIVSIERVTPSGTREAERLSKVVGREISPQTMVESGVDEKTQKINGIVFSIMMEPDLCPHCRKALFEAMVTLNILNFSGTVLMGVLENGFAPNNTSEARLVSKALKASLDIAKAHTEVHDVCKMLFRVNEHIAEQGLVFHNQENDIIALLHATAKAYFKNKNKAKEGELIHLVDDPDAEGGEQNDNEKPHGSIH